jgi:hypothetical protein
MEQGLKQMMDVPDLSQEDLEEMMKLLESYETSAQRLGPVPEELQVLLSLMCGLSRMFCCTEAALTSISSKQPDLVHSELQELMNNVKRAKGQLAGDAEAQYITPEPG